ncbi:MAG: HEAT repeat domain-containing protein [Pirellulales bacterium]
MANRLQKTIQVLARTRNRAVLPLLAAGLQSNSPQIRAAAIRATLQRVDLESHSRLIRHFTRLGEAERAILSEAHRAMPHHAAPALKAALVARDTRLCDNACQMILLCNDFDSLPALLKAADKQQQAQAIQIAATILQLAERLHERLTAWAAGERAKADPTFVRHHVLAALTRSLGHAKHVHSEILEAFLLLAPSDDATLLRILRDSQHACHAKLVTVLTASVRQSTFERLVALLCDTDAPAAALEALASRIDPPFVEFLLQSLRHPVPLRVLHNMKRLRSIAWLESHREMLLDLDGRSQALAVELAAASVMERSAFFDLLVLLVREGLAEGRRAACSALAKFDEPLTDMLVLAALDDPDAGVQAAAARQLRPRRLPEALKTLVSLLDSPSVEVRDAARSSLAEFNFVRYRTMFDHLDENAARTTGVLVHKVDDTAIAGLIAELALPAISSRLRGIEMAVAMQATQDVLEPLVELAQHENASVRREAIAALGGCTGPQVLEVLERATDDANGSIAATAQQSLARHRQRAAGIAGEQAASAGGVA